MQISSTVRTSMIPGMHALKRESTRTCVCIYISYSTCSRCAQGVLYLVQVQEYKCSEYVLYLQYTVGTVVQAGVSVGICAAYVHYMHWMDKWDRLIFKRGRCRSPCQTGHMF